MRTGLRLAQIGLIVRVTKYAEVTAMKAFLLMLFTVALIPSMAWAKTIKRTVRVVGMQNHEAKYSYIVPGYSSSSGAVTQYGKSLYGSVHSSGMPAMSGAYSVRGATLSLLLPDSRIVVVNCDSKANWGWSGGFHRSCRVPLANTMVHAEFHGNKAKLIWSVSLDGKKNESETYKILGILSKPKAQTGTEHK